MMAALSGKCNCDCGSCRDARMFGLPNYYHCQYKHKGCYVET